jgi:hypothetical protein
MMQAKVSVMIFKHSLGFNAKSLATLEANGSFYAYCIFQWQTSIDDPNLKRGDPQ